MGFKNKPECPRCRHPGYNLLDISKINGKPLFKCQKYNKTWEAGRGGEPYIHHYQEDKTRKR